MTSPVHLFDLASRQSQWLSTRQATVAANIANANTPGFKARDVEPFSASLDKTKLQMTATSAQHIGFDGRTVSASKVKKSDSWETYVSGNSVTIEQELMKSGEVSRQHQLNTSIVKSFHRMIMSAVGGGS